MAIKHAAEYRNPEIARKIVERIAQTSLRPVRLMEVCGTHTMAIFKSGIRELLPETVTLLSGPGCPVCVTAQGEIDAFIALAAMDDVIVTTFGDLLRVPGSDSSLQTERARGQDIRIVYSTMDALEIANKNPDKNVVFLGVGFETTAPTIAASILSAHQMRLDNFSVLCAHKLLPPALVALMAAEDAAIDGFILPGHVSVIIGTKAYQSFFDRFQVPCVIAGFEPVDILQAVLMLVEQLKKERPELINAYRRVVTFDGNPKAQQMMQAVFDTTDATWRGIGTIPNSGLKIKDNLAVFDALRRFDLTVPETKDPKGCACGQILTGQKTPIDCPLYKTACTPMHPVGPCMVSSEGTCAAYYRYHA